MKTLQFDFEFNNSNEYFVTPVCCVVRVSGKEYRYFFPFDTVKFKHDWDAWMEEGLVLICYYASAESRALFALGYTLEQQLSWKWADVWIWWRMLTHSHYDYKYGQKLIKDRSGNKEWIKTTPPPYAIVDEWEENEEGDPVVKKAKTRHHSETETNLAACIAHQLGIDINTDRKDSMRNLIIIQDEFTPEEREQILDYCASDVQYLLPLLSKLQDAVLKLSNRQSGLKDLFKLSRHAVCCAMIENIGLPVLFDKLENLGHNYKYVDRELIIDVNKIYPFFIERKSNAKERAHGHGDTRFVENQKQFEAYVTKSGYGEIWPRSQKTRQYKKDKDTLQEFKADPTIMQFWICKNSRLQIKYFRAEGLIKIKKNTGTDNRIRVLQSPFGTKTSRHTSSPSAGHLLGMSTWIRPLIGKEGEMVQCADFSAQEVFLQGWVSKDQAFIDAYGSGDPYCWFAGMTRLVPEGTVRKKGKYYTATGELCSPQEQKDYKAVRGTCKALLLGVGFGMGVNKLATSLMGAKIEGLPPEEQRILSLSKIDPDPIIQAQASKILDKVYMVGGLEASHRTLPKEQRATTYKDYHKKIFPIYWKWRDMVTARYKHYGCLELPDKWCLFTGEDRANTICNFPIQGIAQTILRVAVEKCLLAGLQIISPHHDAIYILSKPENVEAEGKLLEAKMREAVVEVCGGDFIRISAKPYTTDWVNFTSVFTEDKQSAEFKRYGKYMTTKLEGSH